MMGRKIELLKTARVYAVDGGRWLAMVITMPDATTVSVYDSVCDSADYMGLTFEAGTERLLGVKPFVADEVKNRSVFGMIDEAVGEFCDGKR